MKTIEIGGSSFKLRRGKFLNRIGERFCKKGDKLIKQGNPMIVANPTSKLINPFTLLINFTVNNSDKYQLVHEGRFQDKYKEKVKEEDEDVSPIEEKEMFILISQNKSKWFLKNNEV